jgi:putative DNA modification/repair radical SAM protein
VDLADRLRILAGAAKHDASCASSGSTRARPAGGVGAGAPSGVCHAYGPDGRCISLLKVLLTNACVYDCGYCANRRSSDVPRASFSPRELADLTVDFYRRNYVEGLFLSSGIVKSPDHTMERLVEVARLLRREHRFGGYVHLKAIPGASAALVAEAGRVADRLSVNVELPTRDDLARLAPEKDEGRIEDGMRVIREGCAEATEAPRGARSRPPRFAPAGQSTQMVVGATPTADRTILSRAAALYGRYGLRRVYYSAYSPVARPGPGLPAAAPPLAREHRLYEADWLLRFYGFTVDELAESPDGNLDLDLDPKLAWALRHRERFPLDVNAAPREALLRVPGLGVRTVERILASRRGARLGLDALRRLRVPLRRAAPFLEVHGPNPDLHALDGERLALRFRPPPAQLPLFGPRGAARDAPARTGEL